MDFHGGNIYKILRERKIKNILDYSSNIRKLKKSYFRKFGDSGKIS